MSDGLAITKRESHRKDYQSTRVGLECTTMLLMHSTRAGGVVYIHVLPIEVRSRVRVLAERGCEGGGGKRMQKESGCGDAGGGRCLGR